MAKVILRITQKFIYEEIIWLEKYTTCLKKEIQLCKHRKALSGALQIIEDTILKF